MSQTVFHTEWMPQIDPTRCNGCGLCIDLCPTNALGRCAGLTTVIAPEHCSYCATCELACPTGAIALPYLVCKPATASRRA